MIYQEELREGEVVALWVGNLDDEDSVSDYLGRPFENDFGFLLDQKDLSEYAQCFEAKLKIRELIKALSNSGDWMEEAVRQCDKLEIRSAKVAVIFPNLRYRPELIKNAQTPLQFVGNLSWPAGRQAWEALQKKRVIRPPFPKLIRNDFGGRIYGGGISDLFDWNGIVRLESWKGFASYEELSPDGGRGFQAKPKEDFKLSVNPFSPSALQPTEEQARAFQHLIDHEADLLEAVLAGVFKVYPQWRESYYGEQLSSDGGKTWQKGWDLPEIFPPENMPPISSPDELQRLIHPSTVHIMANPQDGFTRVGFGCYCKWDEEHGLGVLTHKGKVIDVGSGETAFAEYFQDSAKTEEI
ncbi:MAG: hypothetical protein JWQ71_1894 [Pedosphaera sp.]|nr:hypothetical protein [Pedosphaera sp.]